MNFKKQVQQLIEMLEDERSDAKTLWSIACTIFSNQANFNCYSKKRDVLIDLIKQCEEMSKADAKDKVYNVDNRPDFVCCLRIVLDILHLNVKAEGEALDKFKQVLENIENKLPQQNYLERTDYTLENFREVKVINVTQIFSILAEYKHHLSTRISSVVLANLCSIKADDRFCGCDCLLTEDDIKRFEVEMISILRRLTE